MKVCLVFPRTSREVHGVWPPLGIILLGTILRSKGYDVKLVDSSFDKDLEKAKEKIKMFQPDVVGISTLSALYDYAKTLVSFAKKLGCITIMGGPHVSILPKESLEENKELDFVVFGEGEETLPELLQAIEYKKDFKKIKGIIFREHGNIVFNPPREPIQNLDLLPYPDRDMLDTIKEYLKSGALDLLAIRGCPYNCNFCQPTLRKVFGDKIRFSTPTRVADELEHLFKKYKIRDFFFVDDTFTINKIWIKDLVDELQKKDLKGKTRFIVNSRVNLFDEDLAKILLDMNCYYVAFGVESGSQKILNNLRKNATVEQIRNAFEICKKYNIKTHAYFMLGSPGETKETLKMTEDLIDDIQPSTLFLSVATPLLGTDLYNQCKNEGILNLKSCSHLDYHGYFENELPIKSCDITYGDIIAFKKRILVKRKFKVVASNFVEVLKDTIQEKSFNKAIFRWKLYRRMQGYFG